jgi:RND family efflux transporter MFP subunit
MSAQLKPVPPTPFEEAAPDMRVDDSGVVTALRAARLPRFGWARTRRGKIGIGLALAVLVVAAITMSRMSGKPAVVATAPAQTITVADIAAAPMGRSLVVNGSLAAWDELPIGAEAGGLAIIEVAVEEGDHVTKGQLLARLDDSVLKAQLAQADAAVAQAEAGVLKAQAMAGTAGSDVRRAQELSKNGYISGQIAEQRTTTLTTAQADVNYARQALATAKAMRDERAAQLAQTEVRAPTDGVVSKRDATLGNVVSVGQQLYRMIREGKVELRAEVPEIDVPGLTAGQTATVIIGDTGGRGGAATQRFDGKIRLVGATVDPQTRIGIVYIALPNDPALKPGMFVHGEIQTGTSDKVVQVPEESLVYKDAKPAVFVVGADNKAKIHMVDTGTRAGGKVEILSGVAAGDRVAVAGAGYLKDGDLVRIEAPLPRGGGLPSPDAPAKGAQP